MSGLSDGTQREVVRLKSLMSTATPAVTPEARLRDRRRAARLVRSLTRRAILAPVSLLLSGLVLVAVAPAVPAVASGSPSTNWTEFHNGPTHLGYQTETTLSAANVHSLSPAWTGTTTFEVTSSPAVANGVVYVGSDGGKLYAYPVGCASGGGTCSPLWTGSTVFYASSSPAVANGVVYIGSDDNNVYAFAVGCASGGGACTPLWKGATGGLIISSPIVVNGVVYIGSADGLVYAFAVGCNTGGGTCTPIWTGATDDSIDGSPAVSNGVVYVGSRDGLVYAFAVGCASGGGSCSPIWTGNAGGAIDGTPAVTGGIVYVGSEDGTLDAFAVGCNTGGGLCQPLWYGVTTGPVFSSPAVAGGVVYVGSNDHKLYAFSITCAAAAVAKPNGTSGGCSPLWTGTTGGEVHSSPAVANGVVYVGSDDHKLYAYAVGCNTGGGACPSLWTGTTGSLVRSSPAVSAGVVYVGSADFKLYAFALEGGLSSAAATYHAIAPARVLDTRPTGGANTNIGLAGVFTAGTVRTFHVSNAAYVGGGSAKAVPAGATAVTGNVTVTGQSAAGVVALGSAIAANGETTTLNFVKGDNRANNVTLGLASDGTLQGVFRSSVAGATTHLIFDVTGYFTPDTTGATYHTVAPGRVLDSRPTGNGHTNIGLTGKFANKVVRTLSVVGVKGIGWGSALVPAGATAVTGNVTVTNVSSNGYLAVGATMVSTPKTSTLNATAGDNRANGVTVALTSGKLQAVWVGAAGSSTDVIFDVTGYFTADLTGRRYHPIAPARYLDSSTGKGLVGVFANKTPRNLLVGGVGAIPIGSAGISGNLTLVNPSSVGFAFVSPDPIDSPTSSTVNAPMHLTVANGFDVSLSTNNLALVWRGVTSSTADMQLDVTGYWQ
jgi:outer membrane protein assembly factor BamB